MVKLHSIKKQDKNTVEVVTAMNQHYIMVDRNEKIITTAVFDARDNDKAMKEGNTYDYYHFKIAYKRKIGKDAVRKVFKLLGVK